MGLLPNPLALTHYVAPPIPRLIPFEVGDFIESIRWVGLFATCRHWAFITVRRMKMVIHVAPEIGRTMKPRASADEDAVQKPFRAVVTVGSTSVRRSRVVSIGANGGYSDVDADLSLGSRGSNRIANSNDRR